MSCTTYAGNNKIVSVLDGSDIVEVDVTSGEVTKVHSNLDAVVWLGFFSNTIHFADANGSFYKLDGSLPEKLFHVNSSDSYYCAVENGSIFVLTSTHELFKDGRLVADSVSSFVVGRNFCLYTTLQNKLLIYSAEEWVKLAEPRGLEIGSRLVDIAREGTAVTMQMPRGNLETIHPRPFVVETLRKLIDELKYVEAMRLMKKHRIDMNLLCDHNPEVFVDNIQKLLNGLDADLVNLFIASLNQDRSEFCTAEVLPDKVSFITEELCKYVLELKVAERLKVFTVLLSSLLKSAPPRTEEALKYIKEHTDEMNSLDKDFHSRKWLHHVSFFVTDGSMFNAALATYDLSLTVQVAEASNRDPKEYLPLLNELRKLEPEEYRKYRIDLLREDWKTALSNIAKLDDRFEEAVELVKSKGIYSDALEIFLEDDEKFKKIAKLCATHYETKSAFNEALIFFEKAEDYENALKCCISVGSLPALQRIFKKAGLSVEEEKNQLKKLVLMLKQKSRFADAAVVYELMGAHNDAIAMHIAAGHWNYASNVHYFDEVEDIVNQEALNHVETIVREIISYESDFARFVKRLEVVRETKEKLLQNLKDGIETGRDLEDCDAFSEAASTLSMISRRTGRTTSSRASTTATVRKRKQIDRKKQSLKEGGEYEDSAILLTLKKHYAWANKTAVTIKTLSVCLLRCLKIREAKLLQDKFSKFRTLLQNQKHHVWPNRWEPKHLAGPVYALYSVDNVFSFPPEGGMPSSIVLEPELIAPELVDEEAFKIHL
ncbi:unnamed protein product [Auanema sp. JU1783]|nr:unnamed protein product [Auanema sp. JU1783]